ncbi:MAG: Hydrolase, HAD superfamily [uncultured Frankineae bacterium]|uniref:Hydrolase, HAD superfamily n=1 Tax=uncultured Frankineae bacterium TaxID=437475 RepID=A0A6J4LKM6_9ACTN|nr:MAG: Hydrolase, HAD superfamily [uncultured Frankineae bacterium]
MADRTAAWICRTCANQYPPTPQPPDRCRICEDDRQYVPASGQEWTTLAELAAEGTRTSWREVEPGLHELVVTPSLGIGHRGLLVDTPAGGVLWDPPGYLDDGAVAFVQQRGGLLGIARSHPHLCGVLAEWSARFPDAQGAGAPMWVPRRDARWVLRPGAAVREVEDVLELAPGVTLVRCGGHFAGSAVLHVAAAAGGRGALLVGDTLMVLPGGRRVSFMRSYPMLLPLPERYLDRLLTALDPLAYDRLHGAWTGSDVPADARQVVADSAALYRRWLTGAAADPDQD